MKRKDLEGFGEVGPRQRALLALKFGAELGERRPRRVPKGRVPRAVQSELLESVAPLLRSLHGVKREAVKAATGVLPTGPIKTAAGLVADVVFSSVARKRTARQALARRRGETLDDLTLRQLAIGLVDPSPVARSCSAYAYWQATGANHVVEPILVKGMDTEDEEEFDVAAHCLAKVAPRKVMRIVESKRAEVGTAGAPRRAQSAAPASMTVLIHGTFAKNQAWYQPGGDFHEYLRSQVYPDLYSNPNDLFRWSGGYSDGARRQAARELDDWCAAHPAGVRRFVAHSHGANVVNLALQRGVDACTVIHLSPPVHPQYMPDMNRISSQRFFTIRPKIDLVVFIDGGNQDYRGTPVAQYERRRRCAFFGHSTSHHPDRWRKRSVPTLVRTVCP